MTTSTNKTNPVMAAILTKSSKQGCYPCLSMPLSDMQPRFQRSHFSSQSTSTTGKLKLRTDINIIDYCELVLCMLIKMSNQNSVSISISLRYFSGIIQNPKHSHCLITRPRKVKCFRQMGDPLIFSWNKKASLQLEQSEKVFIS